MSHYSLENKDNKERAHLITRLVEQLQEWIGRKIEVKIQLTQRYALGDFDRHGTTSTYFEFKLNYVGVSFSGAKLMLVDDEDKASLEAFTDLFVEFILEDEKVVFVEKHKGNIGRQITLSLA